MSSEEYKKAKRSVKLHNRKGKLLTAWQIIKILFKFAWQGMALLIVTFALLLLLIYILKLM